MISVVIPLYNKKETIYNTLQSVIHQSFAEFEVIVVNDGSKDGGEGIVCEINDPRIKLINIPNSGVSFARNVGILNSKYDYITFLDGDDMWNMNFLDEIIFLINNFPKASVFFTKYSFKKPDSTLSNLTKPNRRYVLNYYKFENDVRICSSNVVIKKECFKEVGIFNPKLTHGEDLEMWKRLIDKYLICCSDLILSHINCTEGERATTKLPPIERKMDYYLKLDQIQNDDEKKYWLSHVYGNLSTYLRSKRFIDVSKLLFKHKKYFFQMIYFKITRKW